MAGLVSATRTPQRKRTSCCEPSFSNTGWGPLEVDPPLHETQGRWDCSPSPMIVPRLCLLGWVLSSASLILHPFFPQLSELSRSLENRGPWVVIPVIRVLGKQPPPWVKVIAPRR